MIAQRVISPRAWIGLILIAVFWGGSFLAIRLALDGMGPHWIVATRCLGAFAILAVYIRWRGLPLPQSLRIWLAFAALGVFNNVVPFTLITWAEQTVPSGLASIINASTALFGVTFAAIAFADERLSARRLTGVLIGFAGVVIVIGPDLLGEFDLTSLGQLALIGAAISYAASGLIGRIALGGERTAPQVVATGMLGASAAVSVVLAFLTEGAPHLPGFVPALSILYLAAPSTALAYLMYYRLMATAGAGNTSLVTLLVAPIAVLLGALVLNEVLPLRAFAGFAGIVLGLLILDGRILARITRRKAP
ncbi:DMT family transporter [Falsirhodobacter sp. alg1]|uniref:DMT family transporter n=1 Tax=Falsirhodobacter sp. alg1 TaxID=1472418 RepID=UPI0005EE402A|nr:DMT family transporter [Falsirhodobacter sp. alg1]